MHAYLIEYDTFLFSLKKCLVLSLTFKFLKYITSIKCICIDFKVIYTCNGREIITTLCDHDIITIR